MYHCELGITPVLSGFIRQSVAVSYYPHDTGYEF
jgi:hypothetical protein